MADRLNRELVNLHAARLVELGPTASGLYAHYERLLAQGQLIGPRERAAFDLIDRYLPAYASYAVLRAGLGELALLLAASGRRVVACEPNPNRRGAIESGIDHLLSAGLLEPGGIGQIPTLLPADDGAPGRLGVGLDVSQYRDEPAAAAAMAQLGAMEGLLIDPRLFLRLRAGAAERDDLIARLQRDGLALRRDYPVEGLFWFERVGMAEPERQERSP